MDTSLLSHLNREKKIPANALFNVIWRGGGIVGTFLERGDGEHDALETYKTS